MNSAYHFVHSLLCSDLDGKRKMFDIEKQNKLNDKVFFKDKIVSAHPSYAGILSGLYTLIINRLSFGCDESRKFLPQDAVKPSEEEGKVEAASDGKKKKNLFTV